MDIYRSFSRTAQGYLKVPKKATEEPILAQLRKTLLDLRKQGVNLQELYHVDRSNGTGRMGPAHRCALNLSSLRARRGQTVHARSTLRRGFATHADPAGKAGRDDELASQSRVDSLAGGMAPCGAALSLQDVSMRGDL